LPLASKLLPFLTRMNLSLLLHIHLHAASQTKHAAKNIAEKKSTASFSKKAFLALLDSLEQAIRKLSYKAVGTEWQDYYESNNNYSEQSLSEKEAIVGRWLEKIQPAKVWDLGGNTGRFSRIAKQHSQYVCCFDIDPACVDINYQRAKAEKDKMLLPLLLDLTAPSPAIGWANQERDAIAKRQNADVIMALGLVHHLAISNNVPLDEIASFFASVASYLIIEFIDKKDSQVQKLLQNREDIFGNYNEEGFKQAFAPFFNIESCEKISQSHRTVFLMRRKSVS
jgi:ribosomal protein L11 methylase PrmA